MCTKTRGNKLRGGNLIITGDIQPSMNVMINQAAADLRI